MRNKNNKNIFNSLKICAVFYILTLLLRSEALADEYYDWASGYKFRTDPKRDGSMDLKDYFKNEKLSGAQVNLDSFMYVDMKAYFPVNQLNWTSTTQCRDQTKEAKLSSNDCQYDGDKISAEAEWKYTCKGDVTYDLVANNTQKDIVGGDTMYGAWSMLFNYLPPTFGEDCTEDGRCFVGNATIVDTKAQKEAHPGLFPGLGQKQLIEAPGEVYYFDQVRSLTQPPGIMEAGSYNDVVLVGEAVEGAEPLDCELPARLFTEEFSPDGDCGICGAPPIGELARRILTAAGKLNNVPASAIWSAMMHEGASHTNDFGTFDDEDVMKWSIPVGCASYEPMPACEHDTPASTPPFGLLKYWYENQESVWGSVKQLDPQRDALDKVSRCNFMDAAFAVADMLQQGYSMWVGSQWCDPCGGYAFDNFYPRDCKWTDAKVVQGNVGFIGQCPKGPAVKEVQCYDGKDVGDDLQYDVSYILNNFQPYRCY